MKNKAIFLDRDGVLNENVWNPETKAWESPHQNGEFRLLPGVLGSLKDLLGDDYLLFLVSNQPSYAKGKARLEELELIQKKFETLLNEAAVKFTRFYYCYHHPEGIVAAYSGDCECRKPSPYFLNLAKEQYALDMNSSWMIGDREADILCGLNAGVRTILIRSNERETVTTEPHFAAPNLPGAVKIIKKIHREDLQCKE